MSATFNGFDKPQSNFVRVPNEFWNIIDLTVNQKMVLLYILRHTWGYQEFGLYKTITIDEFQNGRKYSDGSRMDKGVGFSRGGIHECLVVLERLGYIEVDTNDSDAARIKKAYRLAMVQDDGKPDETPDEPPSDRNTPQSSVHSVNAAFTDRTRSEKETKERKKDSLIATQQESAGAIEQIPATQVSVAQPVANAPSDAKLCLSDFSFAQQKSIKALYRQWRKLDKLVISGFDVAQLEDLLAMGLAEQKTNAAGQPLVRLTEAGHTLKQSPKDATKLADNRELAQLLSEAIGIEPQGRDFGVYIKTAQILEETGILRDQFKTYVGYVRQEAIDQGGWPVTVTSLTSANGRMSRYLASIVLKEKQRKQAQARATTLNIPQAAIVDPFASRMPAPEVIAQETSA